jgi:uncharacterized membrane protein YtjA (UPF0391 family)
MLGWAVTFLIIALVAAVFGFGGIAAASAGIAKFLFFSVPGDVRDLFYLRVERQRSPIISDRLDGRLHYPLVIQFRKRIVGCACLAANHVRFGTANPG